MKKTLKIAILILVSIFILLCSIHIFYPLPSLNKPYLTKYLNSFNEEYDSKIRDTNSDYIKLNDVSKEFITTLIYTEDKRFYSHNGFDVKRIIKSFINNLITSSTQGGSTLTQQLSRTLYLSNEKSYSRKILEALLASKIEQNYSKDEILELYINSIYFGHNLYGIKAASLYYFDVLPSSLDYAKSASLVGILNSPSNYAYDINDKACRKKQKSVLLNLYKGNILTVNEYYNELSKKLNYSCKKDNNYSYSYYEDFVKEEAKKNKILTKSNYLKGLIFHTFLDNDIQNYINKTIKKYSLNEEEIAICVMKPNSPKVIALVGGTSYQKSSFNRAINAKRQIGSAIKPFLYSLGIEKGMSPLSEFESKKTNFKIEGVGEYSPRNACDKYANRRINMVEAIALSDNIYALKTGLLLGSSSIENLLKSYGIKCKNVNPTLSLGTCELSPLELCSMYNSLASRGIYYSPTSIDKITSSLNENIYTSSFLKKRIFKEETALIMSHLLLSPYDSSLQSYTIPSMMNYKIDGFFGAKTGSTSSSNWVCGYNEEYTLTVYVGTDDNEPLKNTKLSKLLFQDIASYLVLKSSSSYFDASSLISFKIYNKKLNAYSYTYFK